MIANNLSVHIEWKFFYENVFWFTIVLKWKKILNINISTLAMITNKINFNLNCDSHLR
jgi:hypothetical protein